MITQIPNCIEWGSQHSQGMPYYQEAGAATGISPNPPMSGQLQPGRHEKLLVNGQGTMPTKPRCPALPTVEGKLSLESAFSEEEYRKGIAALKTNNAAGIDDILVEQLKNLESGTHNA